MAGIISFDGLATGIKSSETVDKIMQVEGRQKTLKEAEKIRLENQVTAWQNVNSKLLDLREKANSLWSSSAWNTLAAKSSDEAVLKATTTSAGRPGSYTFTVSRLAQNHQVASGGYSSALAPVGTGSLTIGAGAKSTTLSIDASNNTLAGVAQAINQAKVGITASVINDGTGDTGYRLLLSSDQSGASNGVSTTVGSGLNLAFATEVQAAQDAEVRFGSGAGAITVQSASNTVTGAVDGLTLNLLSAKPGTAVTLTVTRDTSDVEKSIQSFVDGYNGAMGLIGSQFLFNEKTNTGGILMGDQTLVSIQNRLQGLLISPVKTGGTYNSLQGIGLKLQSDGTLSFNTGQFSKAVSTDYSSVEKLFRTTGETGDARISFLYAGKKALEPSAAGYPVVITQAATRGTVTGGAVGGLAITDANDALNLTLDGSSPLSVSLTRRTYSTLSELATELQSKINAAAPGGQVAVSVSNGGLQITSQRYGSGSKVTLTAGSGLANLGFSAGASGAGVDVAGTINGEPATGAGQNLRGNSGNARTDGVEVQVGLTDVGPGGVTTSLAFSKGVAARFNEYLQDLTDPLVGSIETKNSGLSRSIQDLQTQMDDMQKRLDTKRQSLLDMFQRMEDAVSKMNTQGNYLMNAIAALNKS